MFRLPLLDHIASAFAVFCGQHGDVSRRARERDVSRQTLYRQAHTLARDADPDRPFPERDSLRRQVAELTTERDLLRRQLARACVFDDDRLAQFAATAQALGVSFSAAHALLAVGLGPAAPSVPTLGRLGRQAGRRASATLAVLDAFSGPKARQVAADEIFVGKKPVLMTVEQHSLCWLGGRLAPSRDGPEWHKEFERLPAAEQITRDGGQGMEKGLQLVNAQRRQAGLAEVADQEDHFHILHRGRRGLREVRAKAVRALRQAEQAQATLRRERRKGKVAGYGARVKAVAHWWQKAEAAFDRWSAHERAFERLRAGLRLFDPDGRLNTPERAEAEVQAALAQLDGPEWSRLRTRLVGEKAFTFLHRVREQWAALEVAEELRQAAVRSEGLRRQPEGLRGEGPSAGALRGVALACGLVLSLSGEAGAQALTLVRGVLSGAWRSSSLVEGLNSVLRMQQRRQKRLTQGLLDLKRLYGNAHVFVAGRRKKQSPYGRLGVVLPPGEWWPLLKLPPEQLRQQLSALNPAA
jgi:hypothetical protein